MCYRRKWNQMRTIQINAIETSQIKSKQNLIPKPSNELQFIVAIMRCIYCVCSLYSIRSHGTVSGEFQYLYHPQTYPLALLLLTTGGHHWRPVHTCSLEDLPPLQHTVLTPSGGH